MDEKRFERMENMLTDLIKITSNLNKVVQDLKKEMGDVKADLNGVKAEVNGIKAEMKKGFEDIKKEQIMTNQILAEMRADQDFIWEKAAKNEREIAKIKSHFQL